MKIKELLTESIDALIRKHTAFKGIDDMLDTHKSYRPSINCVKNKNKKESEELKTIADAYDSEMEKRGDDRRAFRY